MAAVGQSRPAPSSSIRTPLFIFGVALALVAFLIMFAFGIVYVGRTQAGSQVRVIVAADDIQARQPISPIDLAFATLPTSAVASDKTFTRLSDLAGYAAVVSIYKGEAITTNLVTNSDQVTPSQSSYLPIPTGWVAMTLPTSEQQGVAGYVAQGDFIDVIATINTGQFLQNPPRSVSITVFRNLYVLRVGPQTVVPRQGQPQGLSSSITVLITQCDAEYLDWLVTNATLRYTLLSYKDYGTSQPLPDANCPSTGAPGRIGPAEADARWGFTKG
jgi:Flp pilus assembly protein CpaB